MVDPSGHEAPLDALDACRDPGSRLRAQEVAAHFVGGCGGTLDQRCQTTCAREFDCGGRSGRAAAEDLLLSGRSVDATEAHRIGLVNAVAADPEAAALAWFDATIAKHSAAALRFATAAARLDLVARVRGKLAAVEDLYLTGLMRTADAVEGLNAFIEKRPARWEDR